VPEFNAYPGDALVVSSQPNQRIARFGLTLLALALSALLGCNGFGTGNSTEPGSTPPNASQKNFRMVGNIGTPFFAVVSDCRSSWKVRGVVPLNIIIVNAPAPGQPNLCSDPSANGAFRIMATKLSNDSRLLSVEAISAYNVLELGSTYTNYGTLVANLNDSGQPMNTGTALKTLAPPAFPDVRFFVTNPLNGTFNAVVEDVDTAYVLQSQSPTLLLFDSPNGNSTTERVDGIFTTVSGGPMRINLSFNGHVVTAGGSGTVSIKVN